MLALLITPITFHSTHEADRKETIRQKSNKDNQDSQTYVLIMMNRWQIKYVRFLGSILKVEP